MKTTFARRQAPQVELDVEHAAEAEETFLRDLERRVVWQVSVAYGLPLATEPEAEVVVAPVAPLAEREPELERAAEPEPQRVTAGAADGRPALPTVQELEQLVRASEATEPARAEEWLWSLSHLREFAEDDGRLPEDFRATVEIVFRDLLLQARLAVPG